MTPGYSSFLKEERNKELKTTILELSTAGIIMKYYPCNC